MDCSGVDNWRMNKRGSGIAMMVEMVPVLIMVSLIAVAVFGISATYYSYDISVRDAEARILGRSIADCLSSEGVLNLDEIGKGNSERIISYCWLKSSERFYVGVNVEWQDVDGRQYEVELSEGDSGMLWVRDLFEKAVLVGNAVSDVNENVEKMIRYNPGYFNFEYPVFVISDGASFEGVVGVEVLINYDE